MTPHRQTAASAFTAKNLTIAMFYFCMASILIPEQTTIDAYSILPPATQWRRIRRGNERGSLHQKMRQRQPQSSLSLPIPMDTSLRASGNSDYTRNSTATTSVSPESRTPDDDDIRLIRFMEEALLELEAFQKSSTGYPNFINNDDEPTIDRDVHYASSPENKQINKNSELSLLFPQIETGATTDMVAMFNDNSAALSVSGVSLADSINIILPKDNAKLGLNADALVDEEGIVRARWLLVAAAALYGTNFSVVKMLGDEMPVGISTSLRFGLAALATLPWLVQGFLPKMNSKTNDLDPSEMQLENASRVMATMYGLEVGLWNSIGYVAQAVGLETTLASKSAFLCSMAVVIVPLLDRIAGKQILPRQWVGALMALFGVAFLELGDIDALLSSSGSGGAITTGDLLSMIQPFTFGLGFWRMEQAMHKYPQEASRMTAAQLMAIFISSLGYGLWTLGVFEPFFHGSDINLALDGFKTSMATISTSFPWKEWFTDPSILLSLFWTGCITTALTIYMETLALQSLSAAETTLIFSTEPLWGTAFAVAVMGEQMGMNAAVGAGLILTACVYSNLGIHGLQEMWISTMKSDFMNKKANMNKKKADDTKSSFLCSLQDHWPTLFSGLAGSLAAWNIASDVGPQMQELDEIVEELIENLVDKL